MAKFNIEVELDWLDDETLDEAIKEEVIAGLKNTVTRNVEKEIEGKMAERIEEEVDKAAHGFVERLSHERLSAIQMPQKKGYYSSEVEYISLSEVIGNIYEHSHLLGDAE